MPETTTPLYALSVIRYGEEVNPETNALPFSPNALFVQSGNGTESIPCSKIILTTDVSEIDENMKLKYANEAFTLNTAITTDVVDPMADPGMCFAARPMFPEA